MTSPRFTHLLTFLPPDGSRRTPPPAKGWPYGCVVEFGKIGLVSVMGPSREATFDTAAQILRQACRDLAQTSIAARLYHIGSSRPETAVDGWSIIVGAKVAFSPTALEPYFPRFLDGARPTPNFLELQR